MLGSVCRHHVGASMRPMTPPSWNFPMIRTVTTYAEWSDFADAFAEGHIESLVACGSPGLSKTHTLRERVGDRAVYLKGNASPINLYVHAYHARDHGCIVIDDTDSLFDGRSGKLGLNVLKALTDTTDPKLVTWDTQTPVLAKEGVKTSFCTSARVAVISNDYRIVNTHLKAVIDRGLLVRCQFSASEVHRNVASWWHSTSSGPNAYDEEVFEFIGRNLHLIAEPSMRHYIVGAQLKRSGKLDWQAALFETFGLGDDQLAVAKILADPSLVGERAALAFMSKTKGSRATFYRIKKELELLAQGVPLKRRRFHGA